MKKLLAILAIIGLITLFTHRAEAVTLVIGQGGTGTSTAPTYGQLLLGNGFGGYTLVSTSSLGILGYSDAEARNAVLGLFPATTSPNVWSALQTFIGEVIGGYFTATSTTATSTIPRIFGVAGNNADPITGGTTNDHQLLLYGGVASPVNGYGNTVQIQGGAPYGTYYLNGWRSDASFCNDGSETCVGGHININAGLGINAGGGDISIRSGTASSTSDVFPSAGNVWLSGGYAIGSTTEAGSVHIYGGDHEGNSGSFPTNGGGVYINGGETGGNAQGTGGNVNIQMGDGNANYGFIRFFNGDRGEIGRMASSSFLWGTTSPQFATLGTNMFGSNLVVEHGGYFGGKLYVASTTATSTFGSGIKLLNGSLQVSNMTSANCDVKATTGGYFYCGTDASSGGGTDVNWSFFNNSGIRLATTTNQVLIGASATSSLAQLEVIANTNRPSAYFSGSLLIATSSWFGNNINMDSVFSAYANGSFKERMVRVFCKYPRSVSSVTSNTVGVCGDFSWNIDTAGAFRNVLTTDTTNKMLWMRMAIITLALGNGGRLGESTGFSTNFAPFYYEATMRFPDANATNSIAIFGFTSNCASADTSVEPANGLYFVASTTRANWIAVAGNTSVYTNVDTGFATTSTTATRKFTIVSTTTGTTMFAINNQWVANITSNNPSPSTQMCPNASISVSPTGVVPGTQNMDIGTIEAGWTYGIY